MIPNPEVATERFEVISQMSAEIASLKQEIAALKTERAAAETRATKAEAQVKMLERQLTTPARDVKTLYAPVSVPAQQDKLDKELSEMTSAGWTLFDSGVLPGVNLMRFVSLIRVAPIPAEPQPAAKVAAAPTVRESQVVEPAAPSAIVAAAPAARAITSKGEEEFQSDLRDSLMATAERITRTNPFFGYQPTKFSDLMKGTAAP